MPDKNLEMLEASSVFLQKNTTGEIEPWAGRRGPMITCFLKQNGNNPGPKGHKTVRDFAVDLLKRLKGTGYYIKFRFQLPDGAGGQKVQLGTFISVSPEGNLTFACRERIQSQFTVGVEKVVRTTPILEVEDIQTELALEVEDNKLQV